MVTKTLKDLCQVYNSPAHICTLKAFSHCKCSFCRSWSQKGFASKMKAIAGKNPCSTLKRPNVKQKLMKLLSQTDQTDMFQGYRIKFALRFFCRRRSLAVQQTKGVEFSTKCCNCWFDFECIFSQNGDCGFHSQSLAFKMFLKKGSLCAHYKEFEQPTALYSTNGHLQSHLLM